MARAALATALLDLELRGRGQSLSDWLGATATSVPAGVSIGIMDSIPDLLDAVGAFVDQGYPRVKLKIEPGWDLEPVRAVRQQHGDSLDLQVDANAAYTLADARHLAKLDAFDLVLIEQPLAAGDLYRHAQLAQCLQTPICLDESIKSATDAVDAIAMGACSIINIKPGRVGGYLEARRIHDVCLANDVPAWCGGMLESGIGRAANLALAAMPGCTLPGDVSASDRYWVEDITTPFVLEDGHVRVPTGPGIGVIPDVERLNAFAVSREWIPIEPARRPHEGALQGIRRPWS
jgi:O-succinylbenzoate synthase